VENCTTLNSASTSYAWPNGAAFDRTSSTSDCQRHNVGVLHNVDFNHLIQSRPTRVASTAGSAVVAADWNQRLLRSKVPVCLAPWPYSSRCISYRHLGEVTSSKHRPSAPSGDYRRSFLPSDRSSGCM